MFLTTTRRSSYLLALRCSPDVVAPSLLEKGKGCALDQIRLLPVVALTRSSTLSCVASTGPPLFVGNVAFASPTLCARCPFLVGSHGPSTCDLLGNGASS